MILTVCCCCCCCCCCVIFQIHFQRGERHTELEKVLRNVDLRERERERERERCNIVIQPHHHHPFSVFFFLRERARERELTYQTSVRSSSCIESSARTSLSPPWDTSHPPFCKCPPTSQYNQSNRPYSFLFCAGFWLSLYSMKINDPKIFSMWPHCNGVLYYVCVCVCFVIIIIYYYYYY